MSRLMSDFIPSHQTELLLDLVGREAACGAGKSLQRLVGRKESDFTQSFSARGRPFGSGRRPAAGAAHEQRWTSERSGRTYSRERLLVPIGLVGAMKRGDRHGHIHKFPGPRRVEPDFFVVATNRL